MVVVGVLGPVVLHGADGAPVPVGSGRQRRLLAALALHAGRDVDRDVLAELVWGDQQPADPVAALQTCVARLRRVLPAAVVDHDRVARLPAGRRAPTALDALRFRAHLDAAAAAADPGSGSTSSTRRCGCGAAARSPTSSTRRSAPRSPG